MNQINLQDIAGGALQEQFTAALADVFENMLDPNTPFKPYRGITVKLKFTQNEARDDVRCEVSVDKKLAAAN